MELYKVTQKLLYRTEINHMIFKDADEKIDLYRVLEDKTYSGDLIEYKIEEVDLETCKLDEIIVGLSMSDFIKLFNYFSYNQSK
jgi:hypothetical protein